MVVRAIGAVGLLAATGDVHFVMKKGTWVPGEPVLVKTYSGSETGDLLNFMEKVI